jgi:hypothetical protein
MRKTKDQIVADLKSVGYIVTSNRKEGKTDAQVKHPLTMRRISATVPTSKWSEIEWWKKGPMSKAEKEVIKEVKLAVGKDAKFDLCDYEFGYTDGDSNPVDGYIDFYVYTLD